MRKLRAISGAALNGEYVLSVWGYSVKLLLAGCLLRFDDLVLVVKEGREKKQVKEGEINLNLIKQHSRPRQTEPSSCRALVRIWPVTTA